MPSCFVFAHVPLRILVALCLLLVAAARVDAGAEPPGHHDASQLASLRGACIVIPPDQPTYVRRCVEELRTLIERHTGKAPEVQAPSRRREDAAGGPVIKIGLAADKWHPEGESFVVETRWADERGGGHAVVAITGTGPPGLKFGIVELIRLLRVGDGDVRIAVPLHVARSPRFATRSMYAHLHWSYNRPYALRSWPLEDWKRYVDLLTHLGFNTIQIWPMMELLPHPLSADDEAYLKRYAAIVHYAHEQRGMKVFLGSCPNNITEDAKGVPIAKREYFDFEKRLDPGKPEDLKRVLEYRSDLYRTVPDADGYWVIDSDPGGWKGSPSSDFVNILIGHRGLIDRYGKRPAEQSLIYWMWFGWGTGTPEQNWRATLADMKARLPGPWRIHACNPQHLAVCRELGVLDRAIYFPYNCLETEPGGPLTELRFAAIQEAARIAAQAGLTAVQGNTQTPLVQLPNIAALAFAAWGGDPDKQGDEVLRQLAERIVSRDADALTAAWRSLAKQDAAESLRLSERLRALTKDDSARGTLAAILGDWQPRILDDLAAMLSLHARAVVFAQDIAKGADEAVLVKDLTGYLDEAASWLERTGYHGRDPVTHESYRGIVVTALSSLETRWGPGVWRQRVFDAAASAVRARHDPKVVDMLSEGFLVKYR